MVKEMWDRKAYVRSVASDLWGCQSKDATSVVDSRALSTAVDLLDKYAETLSRAIEVNQDDERTARMLADQHIGEVHACIDRYVCIVRAITCGMCHERAQAQKREEELLAERDSAREAILYVQRTSDARVTELLAEIERLRGSGGRWPKR